MCFYISRENRKKLNSYSYPQKIVLGAFQPLSAYILNKLFKLAFKIQKSNLADYPKYTFFQTTTYDKQGNLALAEKAIYDRNRKKVVIRESLVIYISSKVSRKEKIYQQTSLNRFTYNKDEDYDNDKRILIANTTKITTSLNLPLANSIVLIDTPQEPRNVIQLASRVRRIYISQKNPQIEFFYLRYTIKDIQQSKRLGEKHTSRQQIIAEIRRNAAANNEDNRGDIIQIAGQYELTLRQLDSIIYVVYSYALYSILYIYLKEG